MGLHSSNTLGGGSGICRTVTEYLRSESVSRRLTKPDLTTDMPPPSSSAALHLQVLPEPFFVVQLGQNEEMAPCILKDLTSGKGGFFAVTRTKEEVSIVGEGYKWMPKKYEEQCVWHCIKIRGPMEHSE